jgi:hypothetical protein
MTELWSASSAMSRFDWRQDIRPVLAGNIGGSTFALVILTRVFNLVQRARGSVPYPAMPESPASGKTPGVQLDLKPGEPVAIRRKLAVADTLVKGRTRGLWFDRDMIRYCGQRATVCTHVSRVIHEATGKMVVMKTPLVVLDDVIATGEFLRICPQHEYIFWRDAWLERTSTDAKMPAHSAEGTK